MRTPRSLVLSVTSILILALADSAVPQDQHFHPKGKMPSAYTIESQRHQREILPFVDQRDLEEARRGFIAAPAYKVIEKDSGGVSWNFGRFDFLLEGKEFESIHPSLQRQAMLNMEYGLYEVVPGIYQVRGFDLANISFIKGKTGWIILDTGTVKETSRAALKFINEKLGPRPVVAVIFSHSHADHFGGVRGVVDEAAYEAGKLPIIAPENFLDEAVSENVYAGNAMNRRKTYTYGDLVPASPYGNVDMAIGKATAAGATGIMRPTISISKPFEELTIDGVRMVFQPTPGTEAPVEMNTYFPESKVLWAAENVVNGLHNILTLRGAQVRDALAWAKFLSESLNKWGDEAEVMFTAHNWPRWGNARIQEVVRGQRAMYAHLNNQVLHLVNTGVSISQIHNVYEPPRSLQNEWFARGYHGTYLHNSRAVIQRYLGFWDCNPATLVPLSPADSAPLYVEMMGGADRILARGQQLYDQGQYLLAQEILNKLVYAEPKNQKAKDLLADVWEQLGYQAEGAGLRNIYLAGAKELRDGIIPAPRAAASPDFARGMSTELYLQFLSIQVDSRKAEDLKFTINLVTPDNGEAFVMEMSYATLIVETRRQAKNPNLTITIKRSDLEEIIIGAATFESMAKEGRAKLEGNVQVLAQLLSTMTAFDPWFEILPGTKNPTAMPIPPPRQEQAQRKSQP